MPISYKADIIYNGGKDLDAKVRVSYFYPIIRFKLDFNLEDGLLYNLKVLFFKIIDSEDVDEDEEDDDASKENETKNITKDKANDKKIESNSKEKDATKDNASISNTHYVSDSSADEYADFYDTDFYELEHFIDEKEEDLDNTKDNNANITSEIEDKIIADIKSKDETISEVKSDIADIETNLKDNNEKEIVDESDDSKIEDLEFEDDKITVFERIRAFFSGIRLFFKGIKKFILKIKNAIDSGVSLVHNIEDGLREAHQKYKEVRKTLDKGIYKGKRFKRLYDLDSTKKTIELAKRQGFKIIKHILPNKVRGYIYYGFDDPATTGQLLALISAFYPVIAPRFQIVPNFEETVIEADVHIKGRIHLIVIVLAALRIVISPNTIRTAKRAMKIAKN
ncbi:MAG: DUF2953 domain-containing protein [Lachnospiraceae bacterium]|nr:DUF2953 domain-containing protein [Lachnospiraceae bacterium]